MDNREIFLDISKIPDESIAIRLGQKDKNGTTLVVNVLDHGEPFDMTDLDVSLLIKFSDDDMYEFTGEVDESAVEFVIDASDMNSGMTDNAYVSIDGGDFILSTARFTVEVLESAERS